MKKNARMLTVTATYTSSYRILSSKFYGIILPSKSIDDFDQKISEIKKAYPDASHHCYAWRINPFQPEEFTQDDGEPSGTAGLPILNVLKSAQLCNCGIVVVRYFGGTKLGKAGLIDAYGEAASMAVEEAKTVTITTGCAFSITFDYTQKRTIDHLIKQYAGIIHDATYLENVSYIIHIETEYETLFHQELNKLEWLGISYQRTHDVLITGL